MKTLDSFFNKYERMIIGVVLLIAAFVRLYKIQDYITFLGDEGRDALIVKGILEGHLTLLGPRASAGDFYTGPIYYYMMAPFLWLFHLNPVGPAVMIALLGIATVLLVYYISKKFFGEFAGFFAATLYSLSPLVIIYARSSWNPNPMPFFTLLLLYILYLGVKKNIGKYLFLSGILYGISLQLHYIEVFTGIIVFFFVLLGNWLFIFKQNKSQLRFSQKIFALGKQYLQIFIGFLIAFSPFLLFEIRHQFENTKAILYFIIHGDPHANDLTNFPFWQTISDVFFRLFGHLIFFYPASDRLHLFSPIILAIWMAVIILFSISAIYFLRFAKDKLFSLLLFLWLVLGVGLFSFYHKPIYDYYFEFMFPLPFLLAGNLLSRVFQLKKWQPIARIKVIVLFLFIIGCFLWWDPLHFPGNKQSQQMQTIADFVLTKTDNQPFNFALLTVGNSDYAYRYFFSLAGRDPVTIENPAVDPPRKSVTNQLLVICEDLNCKPLGNPLWEVAGFGQAQIVGEWPISVVKVYKLIHYSKGK